MDEVSDIKKELERTIPSNDGKRALELLRSLESIPMSIDILQTTHIGLTVNKIRKEISNSEVGSLSKSMVKKWKKLVAPSSNSGSSNSANAGTTSNNSGSTNNHSSVNVEAQESRHNNNGSLSNQAPVSAGPQVGSLNSGSNSLGSNSTAYPSSDSVSATPAKTTAVNNLSSQNDSNLNSQSVGRSKRPAPSQTEVPSTSCPVRLKSRQLLETHLKKPLPDELCREAFLEEDIIAARIEECIYQEFRSIDAKYKNRIRSRLSNLGDTRNPFLRYKVLRGDITPDRIAKMSAEEMASDDLKKERERYTQESINDHQMSLTTGTRTSEIKCPACKKCDVTYNQMQTRSADEPMTTFCHCNECGKRWKFC